MAKKKPGMTTAEQVEKFHAHVRELIDAGDINPTEADKRFEQVLNAVVAKGHALTQSVADEPRAEP